METSAFITMEPEQAIKEYILQAVAQDERPNLYDFVTKYRDFITSVQCENPGDFWSSQLLSISEELNVSLGKGKKVNWATLKAASSESSDNSKTLSSGTKRSRSTYNSKIESPPVTEAIMLQFKCTFESFDDNQKWKLGDGQFVEDILYKYGLNCTYQHAVHSWILDVDDPCWLKNEVFTETQLKEIRCAGDPSLPNLSNGVKAIFEVCTSSIKESAANEESTPSTTALDFEKSVLKSLWEKVRDCGRFDPFDECDEEWLQSVLLDFLRLYRWNVLSWISTGGSEADFVVRVWSFLDRCFDSLNIQTRRDQTSVSAAADANRDKAVTGKSPVEPCQPSFRPDLILFRDGNEFGAAECGKADDNNGQTQKEIVETQLHCPKLLKSMLLHAVAKCNNEITVARSLKTIGMVQFHLRMAVMVMDCPAGFICRLNRTPTYQIAAVPSLLQSGLLPILKLTLKCKGIVNNSIKVVKKALQGEQEEPNVISKMPAQRTIALPPNAQSKEKKQKVSM